jgi:hypothetical protein
MAAAGPSKAADKTELKKRLAQLLRRSGNKVCADCPEKRPTWGSIVKPNPESPIGSQTMVAFVCFQCAGIHRRLGTHVCFVRSVSLDDWNFSDVHVAEVSGNDIVNRIYEPNLQRIQQHADSTNIKPLAGAHVATRERYIRSKYIDLMYYSKHAHYDYINELQQQQQQQQRQPPAPNKAITGLTPIKSPMKKLGMFLQNEKVSLMRKVGGKSVCSSTYESSGDEKSFLSAPVLTFSKDSIASSSIDTGRSISQSVCVPSAPKQLKKGRRPDLNSSGIISHNESTQSLAFDVLDMEEQRRRRSYSNDRSPPNRYNNSNKSASLDFHCSQEQLPSGSGHNFLGKPAPMHKDPRRTAFHSSRNGFDVSPEELTNNSNHNPKPRPTLVSANPTRSKNANSRVNMYAHGARGRSSSKNRNREASLENGRRPRSSSRTIRDKADLAGGGTKSGSSGRGRSKSAKRDNDILAGVSRKTGDRNVSKSKTRSSSQQRGSDPSTTTRRRRGQSRSHQSRSVDPIDRLHNSKSQLNKLYNDPLKGSNHSRRESAVEYKVTIVPGESRKEPPCSRSAGLPGTSCSGEDLSGMILIFDESCKTLAEDVDIDDPDDPKGRHRSTSRTRTRSTEQLKTNGQRRGRRPRSRSREPPSQKTTSRESSGSLENDGISISPVRTAGGQEKSSRSPSRRGRSFRSLCRRDGENLSPVQRKDRSQSRGRSSSRSLGKHSPRQHSSSRHHPIQVDDDNLRNKTPLSSRSLEAAKQTPSEKKLAHPPEEMKESPTSIRVGANNTLPSNHETKQGSPRSIRIQAKASSPYINEKKKQSPRKSGEEDFQVITSKNYSLGSEKGSNHSWDSSSFTKPYRKGQQQPHQPPPQPQQLSFSNRGSEGTIKDQRRCSRTAMAARTAQRKSRKSDVFASLDREENEQTKPSGPLLRNMPQRSKSGDMFLPGTITKSKLMIRSSVPPPRSKSMDTNETGLVKPAPELDLDLELGSGHNNDALLKAWETRTFDTSHQLAILDKRTRVVDG